MKNLDKVFITSTYSFNNSNPNQAKSNPDLHFYQNTDRVYATNKNSSDATMMSTYFEMKHSMEIYIQTTCKQAVCSKNPIEFS